MGTSTSYGILLSLHKFSILCKGTFNNYVTSRGGGGVAVFWSGIQILFKTVTKGCMGPENVPENSNILVEHSRTLLISGVISIVKKLTLLRTLSQ